MDSIQELARFWDSHDLTDFGEELEEVPEPVFEREAVLTLHLESREVLAVNEIAKDKGVSPIISFVNGLEKSSKQP